MFSYYPQVLWLLLDPQWPERSRYWYSKSYNQLGLFKTHKEPLCLYKANLFALNQYDPVEYFFHWSFWKMKHVSGVYSPYSKINHHLLQHLLLELKCLWYNDKQLLWICVSLTNIHPPVFFFLSCSVWTDTIQNSESVYCTESRVSSWLNFCYPVASFSTTATAAQLTTGLI